MSYWVVGGTYKNTDFDQLEVGQKLQKYGPFNSYEAARVEWNRISWINVDSCNTRFIILPHK